MNKHFVKDKEVKDLSNLKFYFPTFPFKKYQPTMQEVFDWIEKKHGLVHRRTPTYWNKGDNRNGHYEVLIYDLKDIQTKGTKEHKFNDIGFQLYFIYEKDIMVDKLFSTSYKADYAALKEMIRILKERKK